MLTPRLSVNIIEPSFLWDGDDDEEITRKLGRFVEAEFPLGMIPHAAEAQYIMRTLQQLNCSSPIA
jgi:hypothetical protein